MRKTRVVAIAAISSVLALSALIAHASMHGGRSGATEPERDVPKMVVEHSESVPDAGIERARGDGIPVAVLHGGNPTYPSFGGAHGNSDELFIAAARSGFYVIECDVARYQGRLVCYHGNGGADSPPISLDACLSLARDMGMEVVVDKCDVDVEDVMAVIDACGMRDICILQTSSMQALREASGMGVRTCYLYMGRTIPPSPDTLAKAGVDMINIQVRLADDDTIAAYRDAGVDVMVFTWGRLGQGQIGRLADDGVAYCMTNEREDGLAYRK